MEIIKLAKKMNHWGVDLLLYKLFQVKQDD